MDMYVYIPRYTCVYKKNNKENRAKCKGFLNLGKEYNRNSLNSSLNSPLSLKLYQIKSFFLKKD